MSAQNDKPTRVQIIWLSACMVALFFILSGSIFFAWNTFERSAPIKFYIESSTDTASTTPPDAELPNTVEPVAAANAEEDTQAEGRVLPDSKAILLVLLVGALGGLLHSARSFYFHHAKGDLKQRQMPKYASRPFTGAVLATLFYLVLRAGMSNVDVTQGDQDLVFYLAISGLVGMFSDQTVAKLKKIAEAIFSVPEREDDKAEEPPQTDNEEEAEEENGHADETVNGQTEDGQPGEEHPRTPETEPEIDKEE